MGQVVYRFYGRGDVLLYVGMTMNPSRRFTDHGRRSWWDDVARIEIEQHGSRAGARQAELAAIRTEGPQYNVADLPTAPRPTMSAPASDPGLSHMTTAEMVSWVGTVRRRAKVLPGTHVAELRRRGWTWPAIGKAIGVDQSTAHGWAQPYLDGSAAD